MKYTERKVVTLTKPTRNGYVPTLFTPTVADALERTAPTGLRGDSTSKATASITRSLLLITHLNVETPSAFLALLVGPSPTRTSARRFANQWVLGGHPERPT